MELVKNDIGDFGIITWNVEESSSTVDFFDLTNEIDNGSIIRKTYQKSMNI